MYYGWYVVMMAAALLAGLSFMVLSFSTPLLISGGLVPSPSAWRAKYSIAWAACSAYSWSR